MLRRFTIDHAIILILLDAILVIISTYLASIFRPLLNPFPYVEYIPAPYHPPYILYPLFSLIWVTILASYSVYDNRRNIQGWDEFSNFSVGCLLSAVSLAGLLYLSFRDVSRVFFLVFVALTCIAQLITRLIFHRYIAWQRKRGNFERRILVIGNGSIGKQLIDQINHYKNLGLRVVGVLEQKPTTRSMDPMILGDISASRNVVVQEDISDVILTLPSTAQDCINQLVIDLHDLPVRVWVVPDYFTLALYRASIEEFAGIPMIDLRAPAISDRARLIKRVFDILLSLAVLPFAFPMMLIISLAIRFDSPGPVIFRQKRVGENGKLFNMLKFRSMIEHAEDHRDLVETIDVNGIILQNKSLNDPRITRVGHFLRRTSLDELPQLFNVLIGDMSLVGPRPELPYLVEKYQSWQRKRFGVPQGITGWWQINGRSDKPLYQHTEDDLYYVQNYSIFLDIQILIRTVLVVIQRKGAY